MNNSIALFEVFNFTMNEIYELYMKNLHDNELYDGLDIFNLSNYNNLIRNYYNHLFLIAISQKDAFEKSYEDEKNKRIKHFIIIGVIWLILIIYFLF
jgi:hypothetical protein